MIPPEVQQHADACATFVVELQDVVALIAIAYGTHVLLPWENVDANMQCAS